MRRASAPNTPAEKHQSYITVSVCLCVCLCVCVSVCLCGVVWCAMVWCAHVVSFSGKLSKNAPFRKPTEDIIPIIAERWTRSGRLSSNAPFRKPMEDIIPRIAERWTRKSFKTALGNDTSWCGTPSVSHSSHSRIAGMSSLGCGTRPTCNACGNHSYDSYNCRKANRRARDETHPLRVAARHNRIASCASNSVCCNSHTSTNR